MFHIVEIKDNQIKKYIYQIPTRKDFIDWVRKEYGNSIEYIESSFDDLNKNIGVFLLFDNTYYYYIHITRLNTKKGNEMIISSKVNFIKTWKLIEEYDKSANDNVESKIIDLIERVKELEAKTFTMKNDTPQIDNHISKNIQVDNSELKDYGKLTDDEIKQFCDEVEKNADFYCTYVAFNSDREIKPSFKGINRSVYTYINAFLKDNDQYIIKLHQNIYYSSDTVKHNLNFRAKIHRFGICFINIITNMGNFYTFGVLTRARENVKDRYRVETLKIKKFLTPTESLLGCITCSCEDYSIITDKCLSKEKIDMIKALPSCIIKEEFIPKDYKIDKDSAVGKSIGNLALYKKYDEKIVYIEKYKQKFLSELDFFYKQILT